MMWVRFDDLTTEYTLFSKDLDVDVNGLVFRASVDTGGHLSVAMADSDDWPAPASVTSTSPRTVS